MNYLVYANPAGDPEWETGDGYTVIAGTGVTYTHVATCDKTWAHKIVKALVAMEARDAKEESSPRTVVLGDGPQYLVELFSDGTVHLAWRENPWASWDKGLWSR